MNINDYSIEYRAINIKNFYYKILGYPGIYDAKKLIECFCGDCTFSFGKYKGIKIGKVMCFDMDYVVWVRDNLKHVLFNDNILSLLNAFDNGFNVGGWSYSVLINEDTDIPGDFVDYNLISLELETINK